MKQLLLACALLVSLTAAPAAALDSPGIAAYAESRFDEAFVALKSERIRRTSDVAPKTFDARDYFLGRTFRELGLRGLALHYLEQAELYGDAPWRLLARRELVRAYFEAADYGAVRQVYYRMRDDAADGEISYFAGLAGAIQEDHGWADKVMSSVPRSDPFHAYALYARAQTKAARSDFRGALADLQTVVSIGAASRVAADVSWTRRLLGGDRDEPSLRDEAQILRGKILYLENRTADARAAFASVRAGGAVGFEAMRGLLLTGAPEEAAKHGDPTASRPAQAATTLLVRATAAEEKNDLAGARTVRDELAKLSRAQLEDLRGLPEGGAEQKELDADLASFWWRLRHARWTERLAEERKLEPELGGSRTTDASPFVPKNAAFYAVWNRARSDVWLRGLIELMARARAVAADVEAAPQKSSWAIWRGEEPRRLAYGLLEIRLTNLEQLFADHRHTFRGRAEYGAEKAASARQAVADLDALYLGPGVQIPDSLENLRIAIQYKRDDVFRLVDAIPDRSTDPTVSLLGNYVDLLADLRRRLGEEKEPVPVAELDREGPAFLERLRKRGRALAEVISDEIRAAIAPTVREETAFFLRIAADNEGALSKLYARIGRGGKDERGEEGARP